MALAIVHSSFPIPIIHENTTIGRHSSTISAKLPLTTTTNNTCKSRSPTFSDIRRRHLLFSCSFPALLLNSTGFPNRAAAEGDNSTKNELIQKLLERSKANKAKYDKERLEDYYKRNYKDYFEFVEGSIQNKKGNISEAEKGILEWLQKNK